MDQPAWQIWLMAILGGALAAVLNGWLEAAVATAWLLWVVPIATTWLARRSIRLVDSNLPATIRVIRWSVWLITFAMIVLFRDVRLFFWL